MSNIGQNSVGYASNQTQTASIAKQPQAYIGPTAYDIRAIKAEGGWIITTRQPDQIGLGVEKYYVVSENDDLGQAISKILLQEALTR